MQPHDPNARSVGQHIASSNAATTQAIDRAHQRAAVPEAAARASSYARALRAYAAAVCSMPRTTEQPAQRPAPPGLPAVLRGAGAENAAEQGRSCGHAGGHHAPQTGASTRPNPGSAAAWPRRDGIGTPLSASERAHGNVPLSPSERAYLAAVLAAHLAKSPAGKG